MAGKKTVKKGENDSFITKNRKASHDYEILERYEAGIELTGTEVKSLRGGKANLSDSHAQITRGQIFLLNLHISPFEQGNMYNHDPLRQRRLLLNKREILELTQKSQQQHLSIIPLSLYFDRQWVKVEIALCKGRKNYDKRHKLKEDENKRHIAALMKIR